MSIIVQLVHIENIEWDHYLIYLSWRPEKFHQTVFSERNSKVKSRKTLNLTKYQKGLVFKKTIKNNILTLLQKKKVMKKLEETTYHKNCQTVVKINNNVIFIIKLLISKNETQSKPNQSSRYNDKSAGVIYLASIFWSLYIWF